jgi:DNA-binding SARP family transcriptional activator
LADGSDEAIHLKLLGGFNVKGPTLAPVSSLGKKASAVLAILAVSPDFTASRDRISGLLWSGTDDTLAKSSLRQTLALIRRTFGPACDDCLEVGRSAIGFRSSLVRCDVAEFRSYIAAGRLSDAVSLYQGPFLDGIYIRDTMFEDWSAAERRQLHDLCVGALEALVGQSFGRERVALARRWVSADPLREEAHQMLIEALAETGARDAALRQFRLLKDLYSRELGEAVSAETLALMRSIERSPASTGPPMPQSEPRSPASPVLAVHPLVCLSDDREKLLFASSLSGSLVTTLSKLPYLRVVAMGTTGRSSRHPDDLLALNRASAADYMLEGQLMAADGRARVNVHLVDCRASEYLFSHRHDIDLSNGFAAQDEITLKVAVAINVALLQGEQALSKLNRSNQLEPWELVLQASTLISSHDRVCSPAAFRCIKEAIRLDPTYAAAHTLLGWWHWGQAFCGWSLDPRASVAAALDAAAKGHDLDPENPEPHVVTAIALMQQRDFAAAEASLTEAMRLGRNHAMVYAIAANVANFSGRPDAGLRLTEQAMRLCPVYPPWYAGDMAQAHLQLGQIAQSLVWSKAAIDRSGAYIHAHLFRVIGLHELGRAEDAAAAARVVMKLDPAFGASAWAAGQPFLDPVWNQRFLDALTATGLPMHA